MRGSSSVMRRDVSFWLSERWLGVILFVDIVISVCGWSRGSWGARYGDAVESEMTQVVAAL
jgi:hypothetical protein